MTPPPDDLPHDSFDALLTAALRRRPEAVSRIDLAGEALTRARAYQAQEARLTRLARIRLWTRVASVAAAALIAVTVAVGYRLLPGFVAAQFVMGQTTDTTSTTLDLTTVGVGLFIVTLIAVVLATLLTPERPQLRLMPA